MHVEIQIDWDKWMKDHHVKLKGEEKNDRIQKAVQKKDLGQIQGMERNSSKSGIKDENRIDC